MDIDKARALSDTELEQALVDAKQDLWQARFALSTRQLKDYSSDPPDATNDRADPDRAAGARRKRDPDGVREITR